MCMIVLKSLHFLWFWIFGW